MREISLVNGRGVALVDDEDFDRISAFRWYLRTGGYAMHVEYLGSVHGHRRHRSTSMHRLILNAPPGVEVDHIDGEKLNNVRSNLRLCTRQQNQCNTPGFARRLSRYKGVYIQLRTKRWRAAITRDRRQIHIGTFGSQEEAARAYDRTALALYGAFARLNFPREHHQH